MAKLGREQDDRALTRLLAQLEVDSADLDARFNRTILQVFRNLFLVPLSAQLPLGSGPDPEQAVGLLHRALNRIGFFKCGEILRAELLANMQITGNRPGHPERKFVVQEYADPVLAFDLYLNPRDRRQVTHLTQKPQPYRMVTALLISLTGLNYRLDSTSPSQRNAAGITYS